jgi:hypothetical protein
VPINTNYVLWNHRIYIQQYPKVGASTFEFRLVVMLCSAAEAVIYASPSL